MAPVALPDEETWSRVSFALQTEAQKTNPRAAKKLQSTQSALANGELTKMLGTKPKVSALDVLAAATDGSRILNYNEGPRTLVLCAAAEQQSPELMLGSNELSHHEIELTLYRLRNMLEPMRLTRVVIGAAGDTQMQAESLTEQAAHEAFWRTWAHHEGAIHFSYGPIPHFPY